MSQPLIVITGLIYAYVAIEQWLKGSAGNAIMFAGYSAANVGVWMQAR